MDCLELFLLGGQPLRMVVENCPQGKIVASVTFKQDTAVKTPPILAV